MHAAGRITTNEKAGGARLFPSIHETEVIAPPAAKA
jgi:hypothetical protein